MQLLQRLQGGICGDAGVAATATVERVDGHNVLPSVRMVMIQVFLQIRHRD
jgi:uncharacterized membrane protein YadS